MIDAVGYLICRSARNRVTQQLQRMRSPRYLAALAFGIAYLCAIMTQQRPYRPEDVAAATHWVELLGALGIGAALGWAWLFGAERVLAFSAAEVTFLFAGPVTRRQLVHYKLLRSQLLILLNSFLWTLLLARERTGASYWLRPVSIWVLLTTLSLHRVGAALVRTSLLEHGRFGLRHRIGALVLLGGAVVGVIWSVADSLPSLIAGWAGGPHQFIAALGHAADQPVPRTLLRPLVLMVQPLTAPTPAAWLHALVPALLLLTLHYMWVVRSDTAFEEAAAERAIDRVRRMDRRDARSPAMSLSSARVTPRWLRLGPVGWPAGAVLWKNLLAAARSRRTRTSAAAVVVAWLAAAALSFSKGSEASSITGWLATTWAGVMLLVGPQWVRNDLREDLLKLDLLRGYPLRGRDIVAAEVAGSTLVLTAIQLGLLVLSYLAFLGNPAAEPDLATRSLLLLGVAVCLPAVNFLGMLIQNGTALLFPAWVHLGSERPGGVEALGQNMLLIVGHAVLLALTLLTPAAFGGGLFLLLQPAVGPWAGVPGIAVFLAALTAEAWVIVRWLGQVFERTDPVSAGIAV